MKRARLAVALLLGVLDTDLATDADDAGAVALLHALADQGEEESQAIGVSLANDQSALALDAINTFFGARTSPSAPLRQAIPTGPRTGGSAMASNSRRNIPAAVSTGRAPLTQPMWWLCIEWHWEPSPHLARSPWCGDREREHAHQPQGSAPEPAR